MRKAVSALFIGLTFATGVFAQSSVTNPPPGSGGKPIICSPVGSTTVCN